MGTYHVPYSLIVPTVRSSVLFCSMEQVRTRTAWIAHAYVRRGGVPCTQGVYYLTSLHVLQHLQLTAHKIHLLLQPCSIAHGTVELIL